MGWCQEFGPQIYEGCDHAMVAGPSACSCSHCGAVCTGKFGGCANVWAKGPRQALMRPVPVRATLVTERLPAQPPPGAQDDAAEAADADSGSEWAAGDQLVQPVASVENPADRLEAMQESGAATDARVLTALEKLSVQVSVLEGVPERVQALEQSNERMQSMEKVLNHLVHDLDQVVAQTAGLEDITNRVAALERRPRGDRTPPAEVVRYVERLASQVNELRDVPTRMAALEEARSRTPGEELGTGLNERLTALSAEVQRLKAVPAQSRTLEELSGRVNRLEHAVPPPAEFTAGQTKALAAAQAHVERLTSHVTALQAMPQRVEALEQAQAHSSTLENALAALRQNVEDMAAQLAPLRGVPQQIETLRQSHERIEPIESALEELSQAVAQVRAGLTSFGDIPGRLETLEYAKGQADKTLDSVSKRFDRLATRVGALKDAPERLERLEKTALEADTAGGGFDGLQRDFVAVTETIEQLADRLRDLERASARSDNLARGLSTAIDSLDQLSAQVARIDHTVHGGGTRGQSQRRPH